MSLDFYVDICSHLILRYDPHASLLFPLKSSPIGLWNLHSYWGLFWFIVILSLWWSQKYLGKNIEGLKIYQE